MSLFQGCDYVSVAPRFLRSINLNHDWNQPQATSGYIVTPNVCTALDHLYEGLTGPQPQRAFSLFGPYGTGKSAFLVYLCNLLDQDTESQQKAVETLAQVSPERAQVWKQMRSTGKGFLQVPITARRRPLAQGDT